MIHLASSRLEEKESQTRVKRTLTTRKVNRKWIIKDYNSHTQLNIIRNVPLLFKK